MGLRGFVVGFAACVLLLGCASASFPYKFYGLGAKSFEGSLLGPEPKDDVDLKQCEPKPGNASPCMVTFTGSYLRLKKEHQEMQIRIVDLERQLQDCGRRGD